MQTKVHISIPCLDNIKADTVASLLAWQAKTSLPHSIDIQKNTYIHYARNKAVWEAVNQKATHLMFIDSDIAFPPDGIERLLKRQFDIVGGLYFGRVAPFPVAKVAHPTIPNAMTNPVSIPEDDVFEVKAIGTGFLLINMDVFKKLEPPFFYHTEPSEFGLMTHPFPNNEIGEDIAFCLKAREAGFKVWVDQTIPLTHIGEGRSTRKDFDRWIKEEQEAIQKEKYAEDQRSSIQ